MAESRGMDQSLAVGRTNRTTKPYQTTMKSTTISLLALSALSLLTSCTFVDTPASSTHTTTTSDVAPTVYGSTETTTTRTY